MELSRTLKDQVETMKADAEIFEEWRLAHEAREANKWMN